MTVAMNDDQFGSSVACGMCVTFQGTGTGIGTMPIPGLSNTAHSLDGITIYLVPTLVEAAYTSLDCVDSV